MTVAKRITISILCGVFITAVVTCAAFYSENRAVSGVLLWTVVLAHKFTGPYPLLGYDAQGNPIYEGNGIVVVVGVLMGIPIYAALSYLVLRMLSRQKRIDLR